MKRVTTILFLCAITFLDTSLIVRHDVADEKFISYGKQFPQICHFSNGEGVLLKNGWILTAGHVARDIQSDINKGIAAKVVCEGNTFELDHVYIHPLFADLENGLKNDIAMVKIKGEIVTKGSEIYSKQDESGSVITLVGAGDKGNGQTGPLVWDKITRAATNRIDSTNDQWVMFDFDPPAEKSATKLEGVSGPGDSGGPAMIKKSGKYYVVGISSHQKGQDKFGKGHYGVIEYYSRVSSYSGWINSVMALPTLSARPLVKASMDTVGLLEFAGDYGFRKIVIENDNLYFKREDEPLILMRKVSEDLFIWDDERTKIRFIRDESSKISGFTILRANGETVDVKRNK